jgi:hypothetical protein
MDTDYVEVLMSDLLGNPSPQTVDRAADAEGRRIRHAGKKMKLVVQDRDFVDGTPLADNSHWLSRVRGSWRPVAVADMVVYRRPSNPDRVLKCRDSLSAKSHD